MKTVQPVQLSLCPACGQAIDAVKDPRLVVQMVALPLIERRVAERLMDSFGRWVLPDQLIEAMFAGHNDGGPQHDRKNLHVRIYMLRHRLLYSPVKIETEAGRGRGGYRMVWREERAA